MHLGTREDGAARRVWIAMSQPQDRRRRARLAANVKRLYPTVGGDKDLLMESSAQAVPGWIIGKSVQGLFQSLGGLKMLGLDG